MVTSIENSAKMVNKSVNLTLLDVFNESFLRENRKIFTEMNIQMNNAIFMTIPDYESECKLLTELPKNCKLKLTNFFLHIKSFKRTEQSSVKRKLFFVQLESNVILTHFLSTHEEGFLSLYNSLRSAFVCSFADTRCETSSESISISVSSPRFIHFLFSPSCVESTAAQDK